MTTGERTKSPLAMFVEDFHQTGFGVIRRAIDAAAVTKLRGLHAQLLGALPPNGPSPLQRLVPNIVEYDRRFADLASSPPLVETLREIFAVVPHLVCSYGHEKPPRTRAHTAAHSDVAHLPGVPHHQSLLMVKVMCALTPIRQCSGGTVVHPGSHRQVPGRANADESAKAHYVLLEPGDLLLFHANIRHTATSNTSSDPRLSIWFVYALPWMRIFPGHEHSDEFLATIRPRLAREPHLRSIYGLEDPYATGS